MLLGIGILFLRALGLFAINPEEMVNIMGGTDSRFDFSTGATLPLIARPWGFNHWAPVSDPKGDDDFGFWFHPYDRRFFGIRCTHQPSPWINDYGQFRIFASIYSPYQTLKDQASTFDVKKSTLKPYYFNTSLIGFGTANGDPTFEFTPTSHGGIIQVTYPSYITNEYDSGYLQTRRISLVMDGGDENRGYDFAEVVPMSDDNTISIQGYSKANSGGINSNFHHYFVIAVYSGKEGDQSYGKLLNFTFSKQGAFLDFDPLDANNDRITLRIGTSFISMEQAILNMRTEVGIQTDFHSIYQDAKREWNKVLSVVDVKHIHSSYSDTQQQDLKTIFYTSLYRASLFPRQLSEIDAAGNEVHWSPFDPAGGTYSGPVSTDSGFWDAYITVYPLLSIVQPKQLGTTLQGWVNAYKEGGWLPKWASPGYRFGMLGTAADIVLSDAIVKNISGFDVHTAYKGILKNAFQAPAAEEQGVGRVCLPAYLEYGHIPRGAAQTSGGDCPEVVSRTLSYLQSDFAISQAASHLGDHETASALLARSKNYAKMFEPHTSFFRSVDINTGTFTTDFDQYAWGGDYMESGPWQYRFSVPYDAVGLRDLYGKVGNVDLCDMLEESQRTAPVFHIGTFEGLIKEQTEMVEQCWGQYAHNDQPVHHMLYMYNAIDASGYNGQCSSKGQYWLRKTLSTLYKAGSDMFPGDEDNGENGAWFVLSSLGLFSLSPGTNMYQFGSPLFEHVDVRLDNGNILTVKAVNNGEGSPFVHHIYWNGKVLDPLLQNGLSYATLMNGGELIFEMSDVPFAAQ